MITWFFLGLVVLVASNVDAAEGIFYKNKTIFTTVQTYHHGDTQRTVHVVGTVHVGPRQYYRQLHNVLRNLKTEDALLLEEFATCAEDGWVYDLASCDETRLRNAFAGIQFPVSIEALQNQGKVFYEGLEASGVLAKVSCALDPASGYLRPPSILERNERRCRDAEVFGFVCQHDIELGSLNYVRKLSDVRLGPRNTSDHLLTALLYRTSPQQECNRRKFVSGLASIPGSDGGASMYRTINEFNLSYRDHLLFSALRSGLEQSKTIVTFWGAMHSQKIGAFLQSRNFRHASTTPIYFLREDESNGWPGFQEILGTLDVSY